MHYYIPTLAKLKVNTAHKIPELRCRKGMQNGFAFNLCGVIGQGGGVPELGGEGQICQNMRRKTDVLRRDDTGFKIKLHKKLHS